MTPEMITVETTKGVMTAAQMRDQLVERADNDEDFRARLLSDSRAVVHDEFGITIPEEMNLVVVEDDPNTVHLVLPRSSELSEEELAAASGGAFYWK